MSLTISDAPSNINFDQEFEVLVNLANASHNIDYFLQVALTSADSTAYFGYTQKEDGTWYKYNETYDLFYKITTSSEGSWSGKLKGKPDVEDGSFKGTGSYLLKIGRYTSTGKSHYWSDNNLTINITGPSPTPTQTLTPTPSPTPTPDPTSTSTPTSSPSPKPTATSTPTSTLKPTVTKTPTPTKANDKISSLSGQIFSASVAGVAIEKQPEEKANVLSVSEKKDLNLFLILPIILSILFLAVSIFLFYHNAHEDQNS